MPLQNAVDQMSRLMGLAVMTANGSIGAIIGQAVKKRCKGDQLVGSVTAPHTEFVELEKALHVSFVVTHSKFCEGTRADDAEDLGEAGEHCEREKVVYALLCKQVQDEDSDAEGGGNAASSTSKEAQAPRDRKLRKDGKQKQSDLNEGASRRPTFQVIQEYDHQSYKKSIRIIKDPLQRTAFATRSFGLLAQP
ncbi:MAG: hypothetical protein SGPRY_002386 [Prymnesium sp.]